jgi:hypothetical protein
MMGWNDHEPWFSKIEEAVETYTAQGLDELDAYEKALEDVTDEMRDLL